MGPQAETPWPAAREADWLNGDEWGTLLHRWRAANRPWDVL